MVFDNIGKEKTMNVATLVAAIAWGKCDKGRVPFIIQDEGGEVLDLWGLEPKTLLEYLHQGERNGNSILPLDVDDIRIDCDADALLCRITDPTKKFLWSRGLPKNATWRQSSYRPVSEGDIESGHYYHEECGKVQRLVLVSWECLSNGLLPVIVQEERSRIVLMMAFMNKDAWDETMRTGNVCYFSRSRRKLWRKGEESGYVQELRNVHVSPSTYSALLTVRQIGGAACHEGYKSCFFRRFDGADFTIVGERLFNPNEVYKKKEKP